MGREFYASSTPDEMVALAEHCVILIYADDFRALLRSGSTEFWVVGGEDVMNVHLFPSTDVYPVCLVGLISTVYSVSSQALCCCVELLEWFQRVLGAFTTFSICAEALDAAFLPWRA